MQSRSDAQGIRYKYFVRNHTEVASALFSQESNFGFSFLMRLAQASILFRQGDCAFRHLSFCLNKPTIQRFVANHKTLGNTKLRFTALNTGNG